MTFNYQAEAEQTNSPHYHATKVPRAYFENVTQFCVDRLGTLDDIKKAIFYGRDLPQQTLDLFSTEEKQDQMFEPSSKAMTVPLVHSIIGIATEAGELLECFDKPEFDRTNFIEEVGDVLWYVAIGLNAVGSTFEEAQRINIAKLRQRYPEKFTEYDANNRDLKAEREVLEQSGDFDFDYDRAREGAKAFRDGRAAWDMPQSMGGAECKSWIQGYADARDLEALKISAAAQRETQPNPYSAAARLKQAHRDGQLAHSQGFARDWTWATFERIGVNERKEWLRGWDEAERQSAIRMKGLSAERKHISAPRYQGGPAAEVKIPPFVGSEVEHDATEHLLSSQANAERLRKSISEVNKSFEIDGHRLNFQQAQTYIALKQTQKLGELLDSYQLPL